MPWLGGAGKRQGPMTLDPVTLCVAFLYDKACLSRCGIQFLQ